MVGNVQGYNVASIYGPIAANYVQHGSDVENLIKFNSGLPIAPTADPTIGETIKGTLPALGIFGGIQSFSAVKKNGWSIKNTINAVNSASAYTARSQALQAGKDILTKEYGYVFKKSVTPNTTRIPFISKLLDKIPGYTRLRSTGFGKVMGNSGAGFFAVIDGVTETFTQIAPAFQISTASGFKQIGKSAVKVAGNAVGWVAGSALGKAAGAAIGTAICPGIGTAIGSFVGNLLGGILGSSVAGKVCKKITGKSEVEKYQEQQVQQAAQEIQADPNSQVALAQQSLQQAEQILAQDPNNQEALNAKASAMAILTAAGAQAQQPAASTVAYPEQQQMPQQPQQMPTVNVTPSGIPIVPGFNGYGYDTNLLNQAMANVTPMYTMPQMTNPFMQTTIPQINYNQTIA